MEQIHNDTVKSKQERDRFYIKDEAWASHQNKDKSL